MQPQVARHPAVNDLAHRSDELLGFRRAEEAREGLFEDLVTAETEQLRDCFVRFEDFSVEIGDEHRVRRVGDDDVGGKSASNVGLRRSISARAADHNRTRIFIRSVARVSRRTNPRDLRVRRNCVARTRVGHSTTSSVHERSGIDSYLASQPDDRKGGRGPAASDPSLPMRSRLREREHSGSRCRDVQVRVADKRRFASLSATSGR